MNSPVSPSRPLFRGPIFRVSFWVLLAALSIASTIFVYLYFSKAFPLVELDLRMDRSQALQAAGRLAKAQGWGPEDFRRTVQVSVEQDVQRSDEVEGGGGVACRREWPGDGWETEEGWPSSRPRRSCWAPINTSTSRRR